MINFFNKYKTAKNYNGTFSEKASIFFLLLKYPISRRFHKKINTEISEKFLNYKIFGYDYATITYLFKEIFLWDQYSFKSTIDSPIIIDCGANIGMSVFYFKNKYPNSRIIAFEANPLTYKMLEKNIKINNINGIEIHNKALFDKNEKLDFFIDNNYGTLRGTIAGDISRNIKFKIQSQRLSEFLENYKEVDLVKMDIEGAEINVINDIYETKTINKVKEYIIEYHHNTRQNTSDLSSFLKKFETNGFKYNVKAGYNDVDDLQDIMIHFYK